MKSLSKSLFLSLSKASKSLFEDSEVSKGPHWASLKPYRGLRACLRSLRALKDLEQALGGLKQAQRGIRQAHEGLS